MTVVAPAGQPQQWQAGDKGAQFMNRTAFEQQERFGRWRYRRRCGGQTVTPFAIFDSGRRCRGSTPTATKLRTPLSDFNAVANKEARLRGPFTLVTQAALLNGPSLAIVFCPVLAPLATSLLNRSLAARPRAIATSLRLRM